MNKFLTKKLSTISFIFIPIIFLWHPNWLGFLGVQPYWPLFWLLPWSMINGSINGLIFGLFLGLILDSLTLNESIVQSIDETLKSKKTAKISLSAKPHVIDWVQILKENI